MGKPYVGTSAVSFDTINMAKGLSHIVTPSKEHATQVAAPTKALTTQKRLTVEGNPPGSNMTVGSSQETPQTDSYPSKGQYCGTIRSKPILAMVEEHVSQKDVTETGGSSGGTMGSSSYSIDKN